MQVYLIVTELSQNFDYNVKQEGAELGQAQPANHKVFGSNGAIFGLNC